MEAAARLFVGAYSRNLGALGVTARPGAGSEMAECVRASE